MLKEKHLQTWSKEEIDQYYQLESYHDYVENKEAGNVSFDNRNMYYEEIYTIANTLGTSEAELFQYNRQYISELAEACCNL